MSRDSDIKRFYCAMDCLRQTQGGFLYLRDCNGRQGWAERGVYFFFDGTEPHRADFGPRVVRVGTHALKAGAGTTLWGRLCQHAGGKTSGQGNHRGSIFRLLVGEAMKMRDAMMEPRTWGQGSDAGKGGQKFEMSGTKVRNAERLLEIAVSRYICDLPFLVTAALDEPGSASERGTIERNSIALLSGYGRSTQNPASPSWLGSHSGRERVRLSGLWNNNYVDEDYDPSFLVTLERAVAATARV